jgi:hypothetical protein
LFTNRQLQSLWYTCIFAFLFMWDKDLYSGLQHLQSRHSTAGATTPVHFVLAILEMGTSQTTCWGWPKNADLQISATNEARITEVRHWHKAHLYFWGAVTTLINNIFTSERRIYICQWTKIPHLNGRHLKLLEFVHILVSLTEFSYCSYGSKMIVAKE